MDRDGADRHAARHELAGLAGARGFAGPSLLAMILVDKYANHQPLNRQSEQYEREGIELPLSTMADHVGACAAVLMPL